MEGVWESRSGWKFPENPMHSFFYKQGSTRQGKKLSNFGTGLKTAKQLEKLYFQHLTGNVN